MSFWDNIINTVKTVVLHPINSLKTGAEAVAATMAHPITTVTQGVNAGIKQTTKTPLAQNILNIVGNTAMAGGVIAGGAELAGIAEAGSIASRIGQTALKIGQVAIKNPLKSTALVGAGIIGSNIITSSPKVAKQLLNLPGNVAQTGSDVGKVIEDPSASGIISLLKEHPGLDVAGLITMGYLGQNAMSIWSTYMNTKAMNKNTEAMVNPGVVDTPSSAYNQDASVHTDPTSLTDSAVPHASHRRKVYKKGKRKKSTHGHGKRRKRSSTRRRKRNRRTSHARHKSTHRS